jgi:hypothetical protein
MSISKVDTLATSYKLLLLAVNRNIINVTLKNGVMLPLIMSGYDDGTITSSHWLF